MESTSGRYGDNTTAYYLNREWTAAQAEAMPWGQTVIGGQFVAIASVRSTATDAKTDTTTGAPAMIQLPANLNTLTEAQKIAWYRATLAAGNSDAAIRAAVEARYGRQPDTDWAYLRAKAAQAAPAAAGGGAGLLIAAAAAYFLLG